MLTHGGAGWCCGGCAVTRRSEAFCLGDLVPDDVEVQAVSGRVDAEDRITDATYVPLKPTSGPDDEGRWGYEGPLSLDRTGSFGYTVRILPAHRLLASAAELGLVTVPSEEQAGVGAAASGVRSRAFW